MWQYFFRDYATHYEAFPDRDIDVQPDDSFHEFHEVSVAIKNLDWFSIHVHED